MPRLTQRLIDSLRAEERDRIVFEEMLPGFGVRVLRSGRKSYVILTFPRNSCPGRMLRFVAGWGEGKGG